MKRLSQVLVVASFIAMPLVSHAADTAPASRAQVRAELFAAVRNGQYPQSSTHYPDAAPDAATTYAASHAADRAAAGKDTSYGPSTAASSATSKRVITIDTRWDDRPVLGNLYSHP
ncbi:DUF4148 domain-containing protein [Paraburkholderia rhizosphaerae]|uniref:Uncharacterized protein DUF4148 n=1 Tax=Paraburkholderia rhizosphaerae TaxID=480658 RepID=A0A4R8M423_9BURK|nr:DUF4148 domain-containing protein [Paraburkholderia rhizosphaerae]TDY54771.1 uncharacterized protein DUF4148 [Paraburkholderia rhizosphaerae]